MFSKPDTAGRDVFVWEMGDWDLQDATGDENMFIIRKCGLNSITQGHDMSVSVCVDVDAGWMLLGAAETNVTRGLKLLRGGKDVRKSTVKRSDFS